MDISSQTIISPDVINEQAQMINSIKAEKSNKEQLKRVSQEFEAVFVTKMLTLMDKTIDREGGMFGEETKYLDNFKSYMFNEMGRQIAKNPATSFGFAKQIYEQMERFVPGEDGVVRKTNAPIEKNTKVSIKVDKEIW